VSDHPAFDQLLREHANPLDWRNVPAAEAEQRWRELREWVRWLKDRYALDHHVVPPCWYLHPALVDLLSALRDHHRAHFDRLAAPTNAAEWQLVFRNLESRLREWASRTGCSRDQHRPEPVIEWPDDDDRWTGHLTADTHARTTNETRSHPTGRP
jgi:hypothetical protein